MPEAPPDSSVSPAGPTAATAFDPYPAELATCRRCPRLAEHREQVARVKRRAYQDQDYWGAPVPGFGDPQASLVMVGLAPGAHGSNRTGRMFTGDGSGAFLYAALFRAGLANREVSRSRDDGLELRGIWITAVARCVPPGNKPTPQELGACRPWFARDLFAMRGARAVLAQGKIAHDGVIRLYRERGLRCRLADHPFGHGAVHRLDLLPGAGPARALPLVDAYHVSQQNTNTGRLTAAMFDQALALAMRLAGLD